MVLVTLEGCSFLALELEKVDSRFAPWIVCIGSSSSLCLSLAANELDFSAVSKQRARQSPSMVALVGHDEVRELLESVGGAGELLVAGLRSRVGLWFENRESRLKFV